MRRKEKEVRDIAAIESVIRNSLVCRLGLARNNQPYVVPLCFGYSGNTLYFHSSPKGKKIDMLKTNGDVCFEFDIDHEVVQDVKPCKWTMNYRSVIGYGRATLVEDLAEKRKGLDIIMQHYSKTSFDYPDPSIDALTVIKVKIANMTAKVSGYST